MITYNSGETITGYIPLEQGNIIFHAKNYEFTFMNPFNTAIEIVPDSNGFIWGKVHNTDNTIAIYVRESFSISSKRLLNTWIYVIFEAHYIDRKQMQYIDGIRFWNGGIKTIYPANALVENPDLTKDNHFVYDYQKDCYCVKHSLSDQLDVEYCFSSRISQRLSIGEVYLKNGDSILDLKFSKPQTFSDIRKYYDAVYGLCAFLTFRKQIEFDKITLFSELKDGKRLEYARCYIKQPTNSENRKVVDVIPVREISEESVVRLMNNLLDTEKFPGLPLFILPIDRNDLLSIDSGKIRLICSAIEMELNNSAEINPATDVKVEQLIKQVKKTIKDHKKGEYGMDENMYGPIYTSISHWGLPLRERLYHAWNNHPEVLPLAEKLGFTVDVEKLGAFCKARNAITHRGANDNIDEDVATTAFMLIGLTYCYALKRIGLKEDIIKELMKTNLIY